MKKLTNEQLEMRSLLAAVGETDEMESSDSWLSWAGWAVKIGVSAAVATATARSVVKAINFDSVSAKADEPSSKNLMDNPEFMTPVLEDEILGDGPSWEPKGNGSFLDLMSNDDSELMGPVLGDDDGVWMKARVAFDQFADAEDFYNGENANLMEPILEGAAVKAAVHGSNWQQAVGVIESSIGAVTAQGMIGSLMSSAQSSVKEFLKDQFDEFKDAFFSEKEEVSVKEFAGDAVDTGADLVEGLTEAEEEEEESSEEGSNWAAKAGLSIAGHVIVNKALPAMGVLDSNISKNLLNGAAQHVAGAYAFGDSFLSTYEKLDALEAKITQDGLWASLGEWASTPLQTLNDVANATGMNAGALAVAGAAAVTVGAPAFVAGSGLIATMGLAAANMYVISQTFTGVSDKIDEDVSAWAKTGDEYIHSGIALAFNVASSVNSALVNVKSQVKAGLAGFGSSTHILLGAGLIAGSAISAI